MKKRTGIFNVIVAVFLAIEIATVLFVLKWGLVASLKEYNDFLVHPAGFPKKIIFENYATAFRNFFVRINSNDGGFKVVYIETMLFNSIIIAIGGAAVQTVCCCIMAYISAKFDFKLCKFIYFLVVLSIALPIIGSLPSEITVLSALGLYDNMFGFVLVQRFNFLGTYFLVFYAAFKAVPRDFNDAARVDGASNARVMFRIMIPIVRNTLFTILLLNSVAAWNDYQSALVYLPSYPTLAYGMYAFMFHKASQDVGIPTVQIAGCFIVLLPILIVYVALNDKFLGNLSMGGVKE